MKSVFRKGFYPLCILYVLAAAGLVCYSFTQIDLNLILNQTFFLRSVQSAFQHIGYFQRPISTFLFVSLLLVLLLLYVCILRMIRHGKFTFRQVWIITILVATLLHFSYPAFSYDMFNYMFTSKTVTFYHKNPYEVIPLNFSGIDPWLSFMRWTHLPSAYSPLWIFFTIPAYIFSFRSFLLLLWNIKIINTVSYFITAWCIGRIVSKLDKPNPSYAIALFALNPLILIESLVSSHNDIVMMALVMISLYLFVHKKLLGAFFFFATSIGLKTMTITLFPALIYALYQDTRTYLTSRRIIVVSIGLGILLVGATREVLPWYFIWIIPFVALLPESSFILMILSSISCGLLLGYAPYLYYGHWNWPVSMIKVSLFVTAIAGGFMVYFLAILWAKYSRHKSR